MSLNVVILAAGKGTRMRSSLPKVLHPVANKPMVSHVIETARQIGAEQLHLVYGHGAELLKAALHRLKTIERPAVIAAIAEARSHGDLSENAEYDAAKERQGFIEGRIQEVEGKLGNAQIIDPKALDVDGRVVFGATVELEDMDSGDTVTYQIVGDDEADLKQGKISLNSPVARSLISKFAGDVVEVQTPGGRREYEILDVRYE